MTKFIWLVPGGNLYPQLTDVEEGGATVFPNQGITAFPTKGSLLLWYNLKQSGRPANESMHGGCPILYGIKWGRFLKHYH